MTASLIRFHDLSCFQQLHYFFPQREVALRWPCNSIKREEIRAEMRVLPSSTPSHHDVMRAPALKKCQAWEGNSMVPEGMVLCLWFPPLFRKLEFSNRWINFLQKVWNIYSFLSRSPLREEFHRTQCCHPNPPHMWWKGSNRLISCENGPGGIL